MSQAQGVFVEGVDYRELPRANTYRANRMHWLDTGWDVGKHYKIVRHTDGVPMVKMSPGGKILISPDYAWDGPSGPMPDVPVAMRASLFHDALSQLMREGDLPLSFRKRSNELYARVAKEDGMSRLLAWSSHMLLNRFWFPKKVGPLVMLCLYLSLGCVALGTPAGFTVVGVGKICVLADVEDGVESVLVKSDGMSSNLSGLVGWISSAVESVFGPGTMSGEQKIPGGDGCEGALVDEVIESEPTSPSGGADPAGGSTLQSGPS